MKKRLRGKRGRSVMYIGNSRISSPPAAHQTGSLPLCTRGKIKRTSMKRGRRATRKAAEEKREDPETGKAAARYIGQECRCHGNRQPSIGIWSSKWNYCGGFDVQYTSGVS